MLLGQLTQLANQLQGSRLDGSTIPKTSLILDIYAIGRGVLADDEQLFDTTLKENFRLLKDVTNGSRDQITSHGGDDAKGAAVVTTFRNFQICVMLGGQFDAHCTWTGGQQVQKRLVLLGQVLMHKVHHLIGCMRTCD